MRNRPEWQFDEGEPSWNTRFASALVLVLDDGRYPINSNSIESAIRPLTIGHKNWQFAGAHTAAAIMSLLAIAKANGLEPHAWLADVLTRPPATLDKRYRHVAALVMSGARWARQGG